MPVEETATARLPESLKRMWETRPGLYGWFSPPSITRRSVIRYIVTAFAFLIAGGVEALIFRLQLAWSEPASADAGAI